MNDIMDNKMLTDQLYKMDERLEEIEDAIINLQTLVIKEEAEKKPDSSETTDN